MSGHAAVVRRIARRQHGVVARRQLLIAGVPGRWIDWQAAHHWQTLHPGVYSTRRDAPGTDGRWMGATLAGGDGSVLGLRAAGELWRLRDGGGRALEVVSPRRRKGPPAVRVVFARDLRPADVTKVRGIPVTTVARTLLDCAALLDRDSLRKMIAKARYHDVLDEMALQRQLGRHRGHAGACVLRELVALLADRTETEIEDLALALIRRHSLPGPQVNHGFDAAGRWVRTDMRWPAHRLVLELDGVATHRTPSQVADDLERQLRLREGRWDVLRLGWRLLVEEPERVAAALRGRLNCVGASPERR